MLYSVRLLCSACDQLVIIKSEKFFHPYPQVKCGALTKKTNAVCKQVP